MKYDFEDFYRKLERIVGDGISLTRGCVAMGFPSENSLYLFLPDNPDMQKWVKKEIKAHVFKEELLNKRDLMFIVLTPEDCGDMGCTGHYKSPLDNESLHCFHDKFPGDINGAHIYFIERQKYNELKGK